MEDKWHYVGRSPNEPEFQNSWVNYDGFYNQLSFKKDRNNIVHLRGLIKNGTVGTSSPVFVLPPAYRPSQEYLILGLSANNSYTRIEVRTNGEVGVYNGDNGWVSFDRIQFKVGDKDEEL